MNIASYLSGARNRYLITNSEHWNLNEKNKTIVFCKVEEKAYEIYFYTFFEDGSYKQCYELVDEDILEAKALEQCFEKVALFIRQSDKYDSSLRNVVTIIVDGSNENVEVRQYGKDVGLYKIKKEWKSTYLQ